MSTNPRLKRLDKHFQALINQQKWHDISFLCYFQYIPCTFWPSCLLSLSLTSTSVKIPWTLNKQATVTCSFKHNGGCIKLNMYKNYRVEGLFTGRKLILILQHSPARISKQAWRMCQDFLFPHIFETLKHRMEHWQNQLQMKEFTFC